MSSLMRPDRVSADKGSQCHSFKGPAELVLAAEIARRYYFAGRTKVQLAEEFRLSRFKVARLLEVARHEGLVKIEIQQTGTIDIRRSVRLRRRFGLDLAVVVDDRDIGAAALPAGLGRAAADLLAEVVVAHQVVGLTCDPLVQAMVAQLRHLPSVAAVQLTGGPPAMTNPAAAMSHPADLVRDFARMSGGPSYVHGAPLLMPSAFAAKNLRRQPDVARALDKAAAMNVTVAGIGRWAPGLSTLYDAATTEERIELGRRGVCAEIAGICLNSDGLAVRASVHERLIAMEPSHLRKADRVIAIAEGVAKRAAVRAALRSRLVSILVTHTSLAEALLNDGSSP
jgi:DNA-binding transcriptional regulator LsrR (DeoR family)